MELVYIIMIIMIIIAIACILYFVLRSPFHYPYYYMDFDISGKRLPDINDLVDHYININGFEVFEYQYKNVKLWKKECLERINKSKLKKLRTQQFARAVDDENLFQFKMVKKQTRYKQVNYVRQAYTIIVPVDEYSYSFDMLQARYDELAEINFECTLSEYHSKDQRKRMTSALRQEIAERDDYTCQICGKYMPDGVGLHIDHIVPIKKGGKSVPSNLQVLCSKCNGRKSSN